MSDDQPADKDSAGDANNARKWAAAGIGSAAVMAALLYVNHAKKKPTPKPPEQRWSDD